MLTGWTALLIAGIFEVGFTTALKLEQKSKNYVWLFIACAVVSFGFLDEAIKTIPLGTAYAVWTGIGAVGTTLVGIALFKDRVSPLSLALLGAATLLIVGLKVTS